MDINPIGNKEWTKAEHAKAHSRAKATREPIKTITILHEGKALEVEAVDGYPDADITYRTTVGLASASWRLLFIREALDLCDAATLNSVCNLVGMPDEYDWSFVRDADETTLTAVSALLYYKVGRTMQKLGLTSVTKRGGR